MPQVKRSKSKNTRASSAQRSLRNRYGGAKASKLNQGPWEPPEEECGCNQCPPCPDEELKMKR